MMLQAKNVPESAKCKKLSKVDILMCIGDVACHGRETEERSNGKRNFVDVEAIRPVVP
jgi:hypothetical protein